MDSLAYNVNKRFVLIFMFSSLIIDIGERRCTHQWLGISADFINLQALPQMTMYAYMSTYYVYGSFQKNTCYVYIFLCETFSSLQSCPLTFLANVEGLSDDVNL